VLGSATMTDRDRELVHLVQVDRHIAEAKNHIAPQKEFIERLKEDGHETDLAEKWLDILEDTLATFEHHRETHSGATQEAAAGRRPSV
jgi:hypothetical protein